MALAVLDVAKTKTLKKLQELLEDRSREEGNPHFLLIPSVLRRLNDLSNQSQIRDSFNCLREIFVYINYSQFDLDSEKTKEKSGILDHISNFLKKFSTIKRLDHSIAALSAVASAGIPYEDFRCPDFFDNIFKQISGSKITSFYQFGKVLHSLNYLKNLGYFQNKASELQGFINSLAANPYFAQYLQRCTQNKQDQTKIRSLYEVVSYAKHALKCKVTKIEKLLENVDIEQHDNPSKIEKIAFKRIVRFIENKGHDGAGVRNVPIKESDKGFFSYDFAGGAVSLRAPFPICDVAGRMVHLCDAAIVVNGKVYPVEVDGRTHFCLNGKQNNKTKIRNLVLEGATGNKVITISQEDFVNIRNGAALKQDRNEFLLKQFGFAREAIDEKFVDDWVDDGAIGKELQSEAATDEQKESSRQLPESDGRSASLAALAAASAATVTSMTLNQRRFDSLSVEEIFSKINEFIKGQRAEELEDFLREYEEKLKDQGKNKTLAIEAAIEEYKKAPSHDTLDIVTILLVFRFEANKEKFEAEQAKFKTNKKEKNPAKQAKFDEEKAKFDAEQERYKDLYRILGWSSDTTLKPSVKAGEGSVFPDKEEGISGFKLEILRKNFSKRELGQHLIYFCSIGDIAMADFLIKNGANVNFYFEKNNGRDFFEYGLEDRTPLFVAIEQKNHDMIEFLLSQPKLKIADHLVEAGNGVFAKYHKGKLSVINFLISKSKNDPEYLEILQRLLKVKDLDVNGTDSPDASPPILEAVISDNQEAFDLLVRDERLNFDRKFKGNHILTAMIAAFTASERCKHYEKYINQLLEIYSERSQDRDRSIDLPLDLFRHPTTVTNTKWVKTLLERGAKFCTAEAELSLLLEDKGGLQYIDLSEEGRERFFLFLEHAENEMSTPLIQGAAQKNNLRIMGSSKGVSPVQIVQFVSTSKGAEDSELSGGAVDVARVAKLAFNLEQKGNERLFNDAARKILDSRGAESVPADEAMKQKLNQHLSNMMHADLGVLCARYRAEYAALQEAKKTNQSPAFAVELVDGRDRASQPICSIGGNSGPNKM